MFYGLEPKDSSIPDEKKFEYVIISKFDDEYKLYKILKMDWDTFLETKNGIVECKHGI